MCLCVCVCVCVTGLGEHEGSHVIILAYKRNEMNGGCYDPGKYYFIINNNSYGGWGRP